MITALLCSADSQTLPQSVEQRCTGVDRQSMLRAVYTERDLEVHGIPLAVADDQSERPVLLITLEPRMSQARVSHPPPNDGHLRRRPTANSDAAQEHGRGLSSANAWRDHIWMFERWHPRYARCAPVRIR